MTSLAAMFTAAKCGNVATYIQSGNVVFSADVKVAAKVNALVGKSIREQFGFQTTLLLRSQADIERIEKTNPYFKEDLPLDNLYVMFLADQPAPERAAALDPNRSPPDQFTLAGNEIFLYLPNGAGRTKLTNAYFDSKLKTVSTARNWRTLQKLLAMMRTTK
jgi:uncharacterized protein (DUF1697 family)